MIAARSVSREIACKGLGDMCCIQKSRVSNRVVSTMWSLMDFELSHVMELLKCKITSSSSRSCNRKVLYFAEPKKTPSSLIISESGETSPKALFPIGGDLIICMQPRQAVNWIFFRCTAQSASDEAYIIAKKLFATRNVFILRRLSGKHEKVKCKSHHFSKRTRLFCSFYIYEMGKRKDADVVVRFLVCGLFSFAIKDHRWIFTSFQFS